MLFLRLQTVLITQMLTPREEVEFVFAGAPKSESDATSISELLYADLLHHHHS